jgi:hypothetical protein
MSPDLAPRPVSERQILEVDVANHEARVAELIAALQDLQEDIEANPSAGLLHQATLLKMELKGRNAAVAVGSARLKMLRG